MKDELLKLIKKYDDENNYTRKEILNRHDLSNTVRKVSETRVCVKEDFIKDLFEILDSYK